MPPTVPPVNQASVAACQSGMSIPAVLHLGSTGRCQGYNTLADHARTQHGVINSGEGAGYC